MAWPDTAAFKAAYATKFDRTEFTARIGRELTRAKGEILARMAALYDVSGWLSDPPAALSDLAYPMAYGFLSQGQHAGSSESGSDRTGADLLKDARDQLARYASGLDLLVDEDGALIEQRSASYKTGLAILDEPLFGLREPEDWGLTRPDTATETRWE
jgi:hypothetical protein